MVLRPTSFDFSHAGPVSSLNAAVISMVQLGADQIIVPVPNSDVQNDVEEGLKALPPERREAIKQVDAKGRLLSVVENYLEPMRIQAQRWPENAFLVALRNSLYSIALGCQQHACVARPRMGLVYDLLPVVDKSIFHGEAGHRFAELTYLLLQLEAYELSRVEVIGERFEERAGARVLDILESALFRDIVQTEGKLGLARNPMVLFKALKRKVSALVRSEEFADIVRAGAAVSGLLRSPMDLDKAGELLGVIDAQKGYSPSLVEPPTTLEYQIYKASIRGYQPPPPLIFAIEESVSDIYYWLNVGEETRINYDFNSEFAQMKRKIAEGKRALHSPGRYKGPEEIQVIEHTFHGGPYSHSKESERYFKGTFWQGVQGRA